MVFVADAGMVSEGSWRCYDFVEAARLRTMGKKATRDITGAEAWQPVAEGHMVAERHMGGHRLVLRYHPENAAKDAHDREQAMEKAKQRPAQDVKGKSKSGRFLKVDQGAVSLNKEAIEKDQAFDGLHGQWSSAETLTPQDVYARTAS